jgi:hypothetical protein
MDNSIVQLKRIRSPESKAAQALRQKERLKTDPEYAEKTRAYDRARNKKRRENRAFVEKINANTRERRKTDEAFRESQRAYDAARREKNKLDPVWRAKQSKATAASLKKKRESDPEWRAKKIAYNAAYNQKNRSDPNYKAKENALANSAYMERLKIDPEFAAVRKIRQLIRASIKRGCATKSQKTEYYLGCTIEHARNHIANQFKEGMNWLNHGQWHIDHKTPIASFDKNDDGWVNKANHYTNLQPLWANENLKKGSKIV